MTARRIEWCPEAAEDTLTVLRTGSLDLVEDWCGDAMQAVSGCLRGLFMAAPGHDLICADYAAIEAVVLAELAGEQWRIDVFNTHGRIYEAAGARLVGLSLEAVLAHKEQTGSHHACRKMGKVNELANGYGGWITSSRAFGHTGTDAEIQEQILQWRKDSPAISFLWGGQTAIPPIAGWHQRAVSHGLVPLEGSEWEHARAMNAEAKPWDRSRIPYLHGCEGMFIKAMHNPGVEWHVHRLDGSATGIYYVKVGDAVHAVWLDGTSIVYHRPRLQPNKDDWRGLQISYEGWNTNPKNGPVNQWIRMPTHGGRLVENNDQMISNRIQRFSQINLERAGYPIVQHVYDENCSEVPHGFGSVEEFCAEMNRMPAWASTRGRPWPVRAPVKDAWRGRRYRK